MRGIFDAASAIGLADRAAPRARLPHPPLSARNGDRATTAQVVRRRGHPDRLVLRGRAAAGRSAARSTSGWPGSWPSRSSRSPSASPSCATGSTTSTGSSAERSPGRSSRGCSSPASPASCIGLTALLGSVAGGSTFAVAGSTLVVFALFQPLRRRIQVAVDRRFDRARYDARRTADAFAERLRNDVDLASVQGDLLGVVVGSLQPASVAIWTRNQAERHPVSTTPMIAGDAAYGLARGAGVAGRCRRARLCRDEPVPGASAAGHAALRPGALRARGRLHRHRRGARRDAPAAQRHRLDPLVGGHRGDLVDRWRRLRDHGPRGSRWPMARHHLGSLALRHDLPARDHHGARLHPACSSRPGGCSARDGGGSPGSPCSRSSCRSCPRPSRPGPWGTAGRSRIPSASRPSDR